MQVLSGCDSSNNDNNEETASEASSNMRNLENLKASQKTPGMQMSSKNYSNTAGAARK